MIYQIVGGYLILGLVYFLIMYFNSNLRVYMKTSKDSDKFENHPVVTFLFLMTVLSVGWLFFILKGSR
jgi:hypothetical protein